MIESRAQIEAEKLDQILGTHLVPADRLREDDFDGYFRQRREALCQLVESAIGKPVQRDIDEGYAEEDSASFEAEGLIENTLSEIE